MKFDSSLDALVEDLVELNLVPALIGEAGIGKSSFVEALAVNTDTECYTVPVNQLAEKADLTGGRLVPTPDGKDYQQAFYPHEEINQAIAYAIDNPDKLSYLFLDEINRAGADLTSAVMTMVTSRKIGRKKLPKNLRLIVAGNDSGNITRLDDAAVSRFVMLPVEPDAATLIELLEKRGTMNTWVKTVLQRNPELVFCKPSFDGALAEGSGATDDDGTAIMSVMDMQDSDEAMLQFTTPRTIEAVSAWLNRRNSISNGSSLLQMLSEMVPDTNPMRAGGDQEITQLQNVLESFTGATEFTNKLLTLVTSHFNSASTQAAAPSYSLSEPNGYAAMATANTQTELEHIISTLDHAQRSKLLVYSIYSDRNNAITMSKLVDQLDQPIDNADMRELVNMVLGGHADQSNLQTFMSLSSPHVEACQTVLTSLV